MWCIISRLDLESMFACTQYHRYPFFVHRRLLIVEMDIDVFGENILGIWKKNDDTRKTHTLQRTWYYFSRFALTMN